MNDFKFFEKKLETYPRGRYFSFRNVGHFVFGDGTSITKSNNHHPFQHNELKHGDHAPFRFWWTTKYDTFEISNERIPGNYNIDLFEGTINRFHETYSNRRRVDNSGYFPHHPVLTQIFCNGVAIFNEDLNFSDSSMWVQIHYKVFQI